MKLTTLTASAFFLCVAPALVQAAPQKVTWTQNLDNTNITNPVPPSITCAAGTAHTENGFMRSYDPDAQGWTPGQGFEVLEVRFGIDQAISASGLGQEGEIRIYSDNDSNPSPLASLNLLHTEKFTIMDLPGQGFQTVTLSSPVKFVNNGDQLVVELWIPDVTSTTGDTFRMGSNMAGQTAECYIYAAGCGVPEPVTLTSLGFQDTHQILDVCVQEAGPIIYCTAKVNSCGLMPSISGTGTSSASATSGFVLSAMYTRGGKAGLMVYSDSGKGNAPFSGGILCVSTTNLRRTIAVIDVTGTPGLCDGTFNIDMNAFAAGALGGNPFPSLSVPGTVINCQWWGRDTVANGAMLSDAAEWTVGV